MAVATDGMRRYIDPSFGIERIIIVYDKESGRNYETHKHKREHQIANVGHEDSRGYGA